MTFGAALVILSACLAAGGVYSFYRERRFARWPTTTAVVVETDPQSVLERSGRMLLLNRDSDHFLEWCVNGRSHRRKLDDDAHVALSGFKLWRKPPSAEPRSLHYNPADPSQAMLKQEFGVWKVHFCLSGIAMLIALAIRAA